MTGSGSAGQVLGQPRRHYPVTISVDALALAWARQEDAPEGALVQADQELAARGRRGTPWVSVAGGSLAVAVVLRPALPAQAEGLMWLLAAAAAADGLADATGLAVQVEWPNMVLVDNRVVGMVKATVQLGPDRIEVAVVSVRLNTCLDLAVLPDDARGNVTSLSELGVTASDDEVVNGILQRLEAYYAGGTSALLAAYTRRCATLGHDVQISLIRRGEVRGRATDVDEHGRLVVATPRGGGAVDLSTVDSMVRLGGR